MKRWIEELEQHAPKEIVLIIAGNKSDLENIRRVDKKEA